MICWSPSDPELTVLVLQLLFSLQGPNRTEWDVGGSQVYQKECEKWKSLKEVKSLNQFDLMLLDEPLSFYKLEVNYGK